MGKISCIAKGARRPKSALLAGTQLLCFGDFVMYKGANLYNINSCEIIEVFYNLRIDLDKLKYAIHISKIIKDVTQENQNSYKILQLYLNTLYTISEMDKDFNLVISVFKLRLLSILGFTPMVNKCVNCGEKEDLIYFSLKDNGVKCKTCGKIDKSTITMLNSTLTAIQYIICAPPKKLYSFNLKQDAIKELELISRLYIEEKLEKSYKLEEF